MDVDTKRPYRSVSQLNQYARCPQSYKLARIDKVWKRPAAWLPQGTAVHAVAEEKERRQLAGTPMTLDEAKDLFGQEYEKEIGRYTEITPNFEFWFRSGPYGGKDDVERRYLIGLEQVEKLYAWTESHPEERIWVAPDGTPGIELEFDILTGVDPSCPVHVHGIKDDDCDCGIGPIPLRGFIDAVIEVEVSPGVWEIRVRDYKTGNSPGDDFQLGVYGVALAEMYDIDPPQLGDYYMAGKAGKPGKPTHPYNIGVWTRDAVAAKFVELEENLEAGRFDPDPSPSKCGFCDVALACAFSEA
ncbi:RecB family exonuclease [Mycobacterium paragordonae]|uniref:PD-(D/E)XK nuclease family protein n=1 Tax=Mycobacterium paragordonae TaxID=1389713 RepID=A0AAJ1S0V7_9MYCO|nr:PD-(D/E)XK nuclease family protein [Mycobacterium paragordonae]MDP7733662.1 PD-(D/E)XK nuclease family protein [Mycobacterium paragordonae]